MSKRAKILIVDDEEDICHFLKSILEKTRRFEAIATTEAMKGIELAKVHKPDLIILDISMPHMDGSEVAQHLLEDTATKNIPVIFLTALAKKEEVDSGSGLIGGRSYLAKPVAKEELINRIDSILKV